MSVRPSTSMKARSGIVTNGPLRCAKCGRKFATLGRNANGQFVCAQDDPKANEFIGAVDAQGTAGSEDHAAAS